VADPFTTLHPNLGVVSINSHQSFVIADIPGLIEGAHAGKGLGHEFLKHIERTKLLLHLLDTSLPSPERAFETVRKELELYSPELAEKPVVVVGTKIDLLSDRSKIEELKRHFERIGYRFFPISSVTGEGVSALMDFVAGELERL